MAVSAEDAVTPGAVVAVAETVQEQMEYGSLCKHGTNIGTPGGADLMCGLCEMGYDTWVNDPLWGLFMEPYSPHTRPILSWRQSRLDAGFSKLLEWATRAEPAFSRVPQYVAYDFEWAVVQIGQGYWE